MADAERPRRRAPAQRARLGGSGGDLPPAAARLRQGVPEGAIPEWPADFPYGDPPRYAGEEEGLFSEEEQNTPLADLAQAEEGNGEELDQEEEDERQ